jgi:hypothetical protein
MMKNNTLIIALFVFFGLILFVSSLQSAVKLHALTNVTIRQTTPVPSSIPTHVIPPQDVQRSQSTPGIIRHRPRFDNQFRENGDD